MIIPGMEMVAEKAELDIKVPADKFKLPEGYTIEEEGVGTNEAIEDAEGTGADTLQK